MAINISQARNAIAEKPKNKGLALNAILPGNMVSKAYQEVWIFPDQVFIGVGDNSVFDGSPKTIRKILDRLVLVCPALEELDYFSTTELEIEIHPVRGGLGFFQGITKDAGVWSHNYTR